VTRLSDVKIGMLAKVRMLIRHIAKLEKIYLQEAGSLLAWDVTSRLNQLGENK
jgi:hypothetical protein